MSTSPAKEEKKKEAHPASTKGLAGVNAGDSKVCSVGAGIGLNYRGYNIDELASKSTFEEVFYLLIFDKLPS